MTRRKTATTASLPSEVTNVRHWRTREDPFSTVWEQVREACFCGASANVSKGGSSESPFRLPRGHDSLPLAIPRIERRCKVA